MKNKILFILMLSFINTAIASQTTQQYFETIKSNSEQLAIFLKNMPKGGDLHNHTGGSSLAEDMISYAKNDRLCIDQRNFAVKESPICPKENLLVNSTQHNHLYNTLIDEWSMRHFHPGKETGHDHFFATFDKYLPILLMHDPEIISETVEKAGEQNELYIELMDLPDQMTSAMLGKKVGWDSDFEKMREKLLKEGLTTIVDNISKQIDVYQAKINSSLFCGTKNAKPGCNVTVRYLYQPLRNQPKEQVFAQLLTGFAIANKDPRVVGINLVQPEDNQIAMRDYHLHMQMIGFLHHLYPNVHISLHAGELSPSLVPPAGLRFHIRDAIETADAERIGHGVDITHEDHSEQLLQEMARKHILVEINLSSNAAILNIKGKNHPLPLYMRYNVPVALSTDDEGILRTNLTEQYKIAILTYHFSYPTVKKLVRNSIAYSFLPGRTLWDDYDYKNIVAACKKDPLGSDTISANCQAFLDKNEKARMQWMLEKQFVKFEKQMEPT